MLFQIGRVVRALAVASFAISGAACGGGEKIPTNPNPPGPPSVSTVTITPSTIQVQAGSTQQLTATVRDSAGNVLTGRTVSWSSNATAIATVDLNGLVTGVAQGSATITASSENKSASTTVAVSSAPPGPGNPVVPTRTTIMLTWSIKGQTLSGLYDLPDLRSPLMLGDEWVPGILPPQDEDPFDGLLDPQPDLGASANGDPLGDFSGFGEPSSTRSLFAPPLSAGVLFTGGYASATGSAATRKSWWIDAKTYRHKRVDMNEARLYHVSVSLPNSQLLVAGGYNNNQVSRTAEIFSSTTRQFTFTGSMISARGNHAAARLPGGRVLVTGGLVPTGNGVVTIDVATTEIYSVATGTFSAGPNMAAARYNHAAVALDDGRVLVIGGNGRSTAEIYNPTTNTFSAPINMSVVHGYGLRAIKLANGRVLVMGGATLNAVQPSDVAEVFDPQTNVFTRVGNMTMPRLLHFAALYPDGYVLVGGGRSTDGSDVASAELFNPSAGTFAPFRSMPRANSEQAAVVITR